MKKGVLILMYSHKKKLKYFWYTNHAQRPLWQPVVRPPARQSSPSTSFHAPDRCQCVEYKTKPSVNRSQFFFFFSKQKREMIKRDEAGRD